jgi:hypothetical protein
MLTVLLYACTKETPVPTPVLDCMGIENGLAVLDECGNCHQSYIYDYVSHATTDINDTAGLVLGATEMLILAGSAADIANNPNWNTGCAE